MSVESARVHRIKRRWDADRKVSADDVEFLIRRAEAADTMAAADDLRKSSRSPFADLFGL